MSATQSKKGMSCCGCGCLALTLLLFAGAGCTAFVGFQLYRFSLDYTATEPLVLPTPLPDINLVEVQERVSRFETAIAAGEPARLELSAADINAILAAEMAGAGQAFVAIADEQMTVTGAFPLDRVPGYDGRYLNGSITVVPSFSNGRLAVYLEDFALDGGREIPTEAREAILNELRTSNLLEDWISEPDLQAVLRSLDRVELAGDEIILERTRQGGDTTPGDKSGV